MVRKHVHLFQRLLKHVALYPLLLFSSKTITRTPDIEKLFYDFTFLNSSIIRFITNVSFHHDTEH